MRFRDFGFAVPVAAEDFPIDYGLVSRYCRAHSRAPHILEGSMRHQASSQAERPALSGTAEHGLRFYALAATAASVSVLALTQPAEGEIIITNKTIPIHANKSVSSTSMGMG